MVDVVGCQLGEAGIALELWVSVVSSSGIVLCRGRVVEAYASEVYFVALEAALGFSFVAPSLPVVRGSVVAAVLPARRT